MRRMPSVFAGAFSGSALTAGGVWNFVSSTRPLPSGVLIMVMSARTSSSPTVLSTQGPWTVVSPSRLHTELGEERLGSLEVVDNDENVIHPLNRHTLDGSGPLERAAVAIPLYGTPSWRNPALAFRAAFAQRTSPTCNARSEVRPCTLSKERTRALACPRVVASLMARQLVLRDSKSRDTAIPRDEISALSQS